MNSQREKTKNDIQFTCHAYSSTHPQLLGITLLGSGGVSSNIAALPELAKPTVPPGPWFSSESPRYIFSPRNGNCKGSQGNILHWSFPLSLKTPVHPSRSSALGSFSPWSIISEVEAYSSLAHLAQEFCKKNDNFIIVPITISSLIQGL